MKTGVLRRAWLEGVSRAEILVLLLGSCLPLLSCGDAGTTEANTEKAARTKPVEIEILEPRSFTSWVHASGIIEAESRMSLAFRIDGTIDLYHVEEGDYVEAGAVIAELDSRDYARGARLAQVRAA